MNRRTILGFFGLASLVAPTALAGQVIDKTSSMGKLTVEGLGSAGFATDGRKMSVDANCFVVDDGSDELEPRTNAPARACARVDADNWLAARIDAVIARCG